MQPFQETDFKKAHITPTHTHVYPPGFTLNDIKLSNGFTCVSSSTGWLKCFGLNDEGQLGYEDTENRGDDSDEMGDYLDYVDLGDDFNITLTMLPSGYGGSHSCLISDDLDVKAWGSNDYGQLGNGDVKGVTKS